MLDAYNIQIQQQKPIEEFDSELLPEWFKLPYSISMLDFIYQCRFKFQDYNIDTSFFSPEDWIFVRRHMPLFEASIDNASKSALDSVKENLIDILTDVGLAMLIVWVLRRKGKKVEIDGDSNIVGDNNQIKFSKSVNNITVMVAQQPPLDQYAMPILAIYQSENDIKYFPLSDNFKIINDSSLEKSLSILDNGKRGDRLNAMNTIKMSGHKEYIQQLIPRLLDKDPVVQSIAADAVAENKCNDAVHSLLQAIDNKDVPFHVKELLTFSIIELGGSDVIDFLLDAYQHQGGTSKYINLPIKVACLNDESIFNKILEQVTNGNKKNKISAIRLLTELFSGQQFDLSTS